jgi:hypothetical protein
VFGYEGILGFAASVHPENPGPLDKVTDVGLCRENAFKIAVAKA